MFKLCFNRMKLQKYEKITSLLQCWDGKKAVRKVAMLDTILAIQISRRLNFKLHSDSSMLETNIFV